MGSRHAGLDCFRCPSLRSSIEAPVTAPRCPVRATAHPKGVRKNARLSTGYAPPPQGGRGRSGAVANSAPNRARRARSSCALAGFAALISVGPSRAIASCTYNSIATPSGVFALSGDVCTAAAGEYNPTFQPDVSLPVPYTGFGFFATNLNANGGTGVGGVINSPGAVTINTTGVSDAYGAWSHGTGAQINFAGQTSVSTIGVTSYGLYANSGGEISATAPLTISTSGAGAVGLYALQGGVITATGPTTIALNGGEEAGLLAALGAISVHGPTTITVSGPTSVGVGAASGSVAASGALNIMTLQPSSAAFGLGGASPSILATGGGTVFAAGNAIDIVHATNAVATFDNFRFASASGNLIGTLTGNLMVDGIFAVPGPSTATVNFNDTIADAADNLLDATNGSDITLNASASKLTGAIQTNSTSTTNVNLTNGTIWTMTGSSTVTNLSVTNSVVVFAPPGSGVGFKTLTVTNYVGSGANITMNATLGGPTTSADQIIVNGGKATGFTFLTINNFGGLGGPTSGAGIPLVVATNGGTVAPGAFALANTPIAGGFRYMLEESNNDWYLVSTPAPPLGVVQGSINQVHTAQQTQIITNQVLNSILLGATQQISTCSCGGGFASVGSFAAGAQGRWGLSDELSLIGGFSYNQWYASGISVENAQTVAGALIYDLWKWGESRPFFEVAGALTPYEDVHSTRYYP